MSGRDGSKAQDGRTPVLVSALRLTLGLATLPLLSVGFLIRRAERVLEPGPKPEQPKPEAVPPDHVREAAATEQAESVDLPARADVEAALRALTSATLPRPGRRNAARASRRSPARDGS